jgi:hypothetical protein
MDLYVCVTFAPREKANKYTGRRVCSHGQDGRATAPETEGLP